jgi:hypothetical protein
MDINRKRIYFAGSADKNISYDLLKYAHNLVRELVKSLATKGATFAVQVGKEPLSVEGYPKSLPIIFDWTIIETIYECLQEGTINKSHDEPLIFIPTTNKTENQIPPNRQKLWDTLLKKNIVYVHPVDREFGERRRNILAQNADILIALSGGSGTESLIDNYVKQHKPVIPLDLELGSSCNDGSGEISRSAKQFFTEPNKFIPISKFTNVNNILTQLKTCQGKRPVSSIKDAMIELIQVIDETRSLERKIDTGNKEYQGINNSGNHTEGDIKTPLSNQESLPQSQSSNQNPKSHISAFERVISLVMAFAIIVTFIVLVLYPRTLDSQTMMIVRFMAASFAGLVGYLFSGTLELSGNIPLTKTQIRATSAFASFIIVFLLFFYGAPNSNQQ